MIEIDHRLLDAETLDNLLIAIVLREGTDYGEAEWSLEDKKRQLQLALLSGKGVLICGSKTGWCEVVDGSEWFNSDTCALC